LLIPYGPRKQISFRVMNFQEKIFPAVNSKNLFWKKLLHTSNSYFRETVMYVQYEVLYLHTDQAQINRIELGNVHVMSKFQYGNS